MPNAKKLMSTLNPKIAWLVMGFLSVPRSHSRATCRGCRKKSAPLPMECRHPQNMFKNIFCGIHCFR